MTMNFLICVFLLLSSTVLALDFPVDDCGSRHGKFTKVTLSCTGEEECILKRNTNVSLNIEFIPSEDTGSVEAVVHGVIQGVPVPFPIPNPDACSVLSCPLKKNTTYSYSASFPVKKMYPRVRLHVKWELQDKNKEDLVCVLIPVRIE